MNKAAVFIIICLFLISFSGCQKVYSGDNDLIEKAREELPLSEKDDMQIELAGMYAEEDKTLMWFISGDEYQEHYYLPMEFKAVGQDKYEFTKAYKPISRGGDNAALQWENGYCFIVNNPECAGIVIQDNGEKTMIAIEQDTYPFVRFYKNIGDSFRYTFVDKSGKEI